MPPRSDSRDRRGCHDWIRVFALGFLTALLCIGPASPVLEGSIRSRVPALGYGETPPLDWPEDLPAGLRLAAAEYKPVFVFFTTPGCGWCRMMKQDVFTHDEVRELLEHFVPIKIDVAEQRALAERFMVRGVPAGRVLGSDGATRAAFSGYQSASEISELLREALGQTEEPADSELDELMERLETGPDDLETLVQTVLALATAPEDQRRRFFELDPFPAPALVDLLTHSRLAVRLGSLELLERAAPATFGYDPWLNEERQHENAVALAQWRQWADGGAEGLTVGSATLDQDQLTSYIQDLTTDDPARIARAKRMLRGGGRATGMRLAAYLSESPDLPPGGRNRIRETAYELLLSDIRGIDAGSIAHRLVFGNVDARLRNLSDLREAGPWAAAVLVDFLQEPNPMVRETAMEALLEVAGPAALPKVTDHLEIERDTNVLYTTLRALGGLSHPGVAKVIIPFLGHENEDIAIVSLEGVARLRASRAAEQVQESLADPRWRVRVAALEAVGALRLSQAAPDVEKKLQDEDSFVRLTAVGVLGMLPNTNSSAALEKTFHADDDLKGTVIEAFGRMDTPLPTGIRENLHPHSPDVMISIIEGMNRSHSDDLKLAVPWVRHENLDVACAAVRLIGGRLSGSPEFPSVIAEVLQEGREEKKLVALESLSIDRRDWREGRDGGGVRERPRTGVIGDLLAAFGGGREKAQETKENPRDKLTETLRDLVQSERHPERRFLAALRLLETGDDAGLTLLTAEVDNQPEERRRMLASALDGLATEDADALLQRLMRDPAVPVRTSALRAALSSALVSARLPWILAEVRSPDGRLKPTEVFDHRLIRAVQDPQAAEIIGAWSRKTLEEDADPSLQILALLLLEGVWKEDDAQRVAPFLESPHPFVRRAAAYRLGAARSGLYLECLPDLLEDPSEHVRAVVPGLAATNSEWRHRFDETTVSYSSFFDHHSIHYGVRPPDLDPAVVEALHQLTDDVSLLIRVEASFALLEAGKEIDTWRFAELLEQIPDRRRVADRLVDHFSANLQTLDQEHAAFLPILAASGRSGSQLDQIKATLQPYAKAESPSEEIVLFVDQIESVPAVAPSFAAAGIPEIPPGPEPGVPIEVVFFTSPGCPDCEQVARLLDDLREIFPRLEVVTKNIRQTVAMRLHETLSERFGVPDDLRMATPTVFTAGGYLARGDINFVRLGELLRRTEGLATPGWFHAAPAEVAVAEAAIDRRYAAMTVGIVLAAGLLDGVNPCAFATIIFLLSYLQVARRTPAQILQVGGAFILGVFLTYFMLGFGLAELVSRLQVLRGFSTALNWALAVVALIIGLLSLRDGIRASRGQAGEMTLQLPDFLKTRIHKVIRHSARHSRFVVAAFVTGIVIAVLELACTGQVYLPTIVYVMQTGVISAVGMLLLYNLAFILPLVVVFALAYGGLRSETLQQFQQKHAAVVKFGIAALFFLLFAVLIASGRLGDFAQQLVRY